MNSSNSFTRWKFVSFIVSSINNRMKALKSPGFLIDAALTSLILLLPFAVFYWQVPFLTQISIGNDYVSYAIQNQLELLFSVVHGTFPLYVPGYAGGHSALALTMGQLYHPISHLASLFPGYWDGNSLLWNTLLRLISLGIAQFVLFKLLRKLSLNGFFAFVISFITVYNMRMLDVFRYGASLENYTGALFLCASLAFFYIEPSRFKGPFFIILSTYLMVCGGHPQMMYLAAIGVIIATLSIPFILRKMTTGSDLQPASYGKYFTTVILSMITGILLSAVYFIPFYKDFLMTNAPRVGNSYIWSLQFSDTLRGLFNSFLNPLHSDVHGAFGSSSLIILVAFVPFLFLVRKRVPFSVITLWSSLILVFLVSSGIETRVHYYFWKYVPMANDFRCPPRITIVFPFLFLLILAWIFKSYDEKVKIGSRELPFSPYLFPTLISLAVFLLYNKVWEKLLPPPGPIIPSTIQYYPEWVEPAIFWLSLGTLILIVFHSLYFKRIFKFWRAFFGILISLTVVSQVTIQCRYGTWIAPFFKQHSMESMSQLKSKKPTNVISIGATMESEAIIKQKENSIIEPKLAKFFRKFEFAKNRDVAYAFLEKGNVSDFLVVEASPEDQKQIISLTPIPSERNGDDKVTLKENTYNRIQFITQSDSPGFITLSYPYDENWNVFVDNVKQPVYRANAYMLSTYLNAGQHKVEFRYWSGASFIGILTSCLTFLLAGVFFAFFAFRDDKRKRIIVLIVSIILPSAVMIYWSTAIYGGENLNAKYEWTSKEFPNSQNLAYAKVSEMKSGNYDNVYAGLGVDGIYGKSFKTEKNSNEWWQVDLGRPKQIGDIYLHFHKLEFNQALPLNILGSMNGKKFRLMKTITERNGESPWHIPMQGEITRFVRLQSPSRTSISFSEVEIFPHPEAQDENPVTSLVKTEPVYEDSLEKIRQIKQAVIKGDEKTVTSILSGIRKEKDSEIELRQVLKYEASKEAFKRENSQIIRSLSSSGIDLPFYVAEARPSQVMNVLANAGLSILKSSPVYNFDVWNRNETQMEKISPSLFILLDEGAFKFDVKTGNPTTPNTVIVRGQNLIRGEFRKIQFGYDLNKLGVTKYPEGQYIQFIVRASISPRLVNNEKYSNTFIVTQLHNGKFEAERTPFRSSGMNTYIIPAKIKPGTTQILVLVEFSPRTVEDEVRIEEMGIAITAQPL